MAIIPEKLREMAEQAKTGQEAKTTVRTLLSWFGMYRRSSINVWHIKYGLRALGMTTSPDFEEAYIDAYVKFVVIPPVPQVSSSEAVSVSDSVNVELAEKASISCSIELADPAHRIKRLASANRPPLFVPPDGTVEHAITLMLRYDYSQLPVMQSAAAREAKGLFSWKSVGSRLGIGRQCARVGDSMDQCPVISCNGSLFDAIKIIAEHDCVLVQAGDKTICGIVTAYDISKQFHQLAEPFLLLGDIENHVRYLIGKTFTLEELQQAKDPEDADREIQSVSDLTFGEYVRLLQNEEEWAKLNIKIDRKTFTGWLDKVRETRNDVMHFDPDPLDPEDLQLLREFSHFLCRWQQITL